jgi:nitrite reductase/ring-hydroxylating ferredoxin subunit
MKLKNGMTVIAPCSRNEIRKGQEFIVDNVNKVEGLFEYNFTIRKEKFYCLLNNCAHINGENWIIKK